LQFLREMAKELAYIGFEKPGLQQCLPVQDNFGKGAIQLMQSAIKFRLFE
jgi:hypothetical protein